jgi:hypothetical protein
LVPRGKQIPDDDARAQQSMRNFMESVRSIGQVVMRPQSPLSQCV